MLVSFLLSFRNAIENESKREHETYTSCMLITENTRQAYQTRLYGAIFEMDWRNLVVMDEIDANFKCGGDCSNYAGKSMTYTQAATMHKILSINSMKKHANENEVVLMGSTIGNPILVDLSTDKRTMEQCKFMASIFNVPLIGWNKDEGYVERLEVPKAGLGSYRQERYEV